MRRWALAVILLLGFVGRLPYLPKPGFRQDMAYYRSCAQYLSEHSVTSIYANADQIAGGVVNYPPVYLFILQILGKIARAISADPFQTVWFLILIKSVNVLADLGTSLLLYRFVRDESGQNAGIVALGLFWMNPGTIYNGSFFGQADTVFTFFLVLAVFLIRSFPLLAGCACGVALGTKMQTLPFLPLFFLEPLIHGEFRGEFKLSAGFIISLLFLFIPFLLTDQAGLLVRSCFLDSFRWGGNLTYGAFNLWQLHPNPLTPDKLPLGVLFGSEGTLSAGNPIRWFTYRRVGFLLFCISYGSIVLYWIRSSWNRSTDLWGVLAAVSLIFFFFPTRIHERYLFPFLAFAIPLSVPQGRSVRCGAFVAISVFFLLDLMAVCPPDSRVVPLGEVHAGGAGVLAFFGLLSALVWITDRWGLTSRSGRIGVGAIALILLGMVFYRSVSPRPLSAYPLVSWDQGWRAPQHDLSVDGHVLRIRDRIFAQGIGTHAPSRLVFAVPKGATRLEAWIGVDAEALHEPVKASVIFAVELDGQEVFRSSVFTARSSAQRIEIPLGGRKKLALVTEDASDGNRNDHADWCGLSIEYQ